MKVVSYTALLYGLDYLEYAIRSVIDHVDEHHVIYSPIGAHGHRTEVPCPESREDLLAAAQRGAGDKLRWHDAGPFPYEGAQREHIHVVAPDADVILVVDADEVWDSTLARDVIAFGAGHGAQRLRIRMLHYWRSFYNAVVHDPAYPIRAIFPALPVGEDLFRPARRTGGDIAHNPELFHWINHFGYAQRPEIVEYKQHTHGHRNEWRRDVDWFNDVFMANRQHDCHPVGSEYWQPETVNPLDYMPAWMSEHPYFNREVIE